MEQERERERESVCVCVCRIKGLGPSCSFVFDAAFASASLA